MKPFIFFCFFAFFFPVLYGQNDGDVLYFSVLSAHARVGDGRSYDDGYQSIEGFFSRFDAAQRNLIFADFSALRVDKGRFASNSCFGVRSFSNNYQTMLGAYICYDSRYLHGTNLNQIGLGAEFLNCYLDVRVNGYIPFGKKMVLLDTDVFTYTGDYFAIRDRYESAMWGLDVEFGKCLRLSNCLNLYAGIGPYFYQTGGCCNSLLGGMGRITVQFWRRIYVECYLTYDRIFGFNPQGEVSIYIPFSSACGWTNCIFKPLYRNKVIVTSERCCWETNF